MPEFQGAPKKRPFKIGTAKTVDMETGKVVEEKRNAFTMLPCAPDKCQECAVDHPHDQPHNQQSLFYQYQFHAKHGRWPTWTDAMAHCPEPVREQWRPRIVAVMREHGLEIPPDLAGPEQGVSR